MVRSKGWALLTTVHNSVGVHASHTKANKGEFTYGCKDSLECCAADCKASDRCVAFEFASKRSCELHTVVIDQVDPQPGREQSCYEKLSLVRIHNLTPHRPPPTYPTSIEFIRRDPDGVLRGDAVLLYEICFSLSRVGGKRYLSHLH